MEIGEWVKGDQYTGRIVRVTNSSIFKEPVFNYSGDFPFVWDEITVPVRYGSDRALARDKWRSVVQKYRIEHASTDPMVTLVANDNWLEYTLRYVVNYQRRRTTKDEIFSRLLDEIDKTDKAVQLASATFELVAAPTIQVDLPRAPSGS